MNVVLAQTIEESVIESLIDGDGVRLVLFFSGCHHRCIDCHNPLTWDIKNGTTYSIEHVIQYLYNLLKKGDYDGVTLSGGDPFFQSEAATVIINELRKLIPALTFWVYTGFVFEKIKNNRLTKTADVIVDGPFLTLERLPKKKFRGSSNQRILHLKNGEIWKVE